MLKASEISGWESIGVCANPSGCLALEGQLPHGESGLWEFRFVMDRELIGKVSKKGKRRPLCNLGYYRLAAAVGTRRQAANRKSRKKKERPKKERIEYRTFALTR